MLINVCSTNKLTFENGSKHYGSSNVLARTVRLDAARTMAETALHQHDADTILRTLDEIKQR